VDTLVENFMDNLKPTAEVQLDVTGLVTSLVIAILMGMMLKILYNLYFRDNEPRDASLARSLVLLTPALTATFWMIQSSLILSLGLLGSLSFVRFRTPVKRAEDVSFIVVALSVAISCAISQYLVGMSLLGLLFIYTVSRNVFFDSMQDRFAIVTFNTKRDTTSLEIIRAMEVAKVKPEFVSSRTYDGITSFVFNVAKMKKSAHDEISKLLSVLDQDSHINIFYPNERLGS
jgi:hypothetical protein